MATRSASFVRRSSSTSKARQTTKQKKQVRKADSRPQPVAIPPKGALTRKPGAHGALQASDALRTVALGSQSRKDPVLEAVYQYRNADDTLAYEVLRFAPKSFSFRTPTDDLSGWRYGSNYVSPILYNLNALSSEPSKRVFIVEGEKDADALIGLGLLATTNPFGAGPGRWRPEFNRWFRDREVVIVADNDDAGRLHATTIAANVFGVADSVRLLNLADLASHEDVSDWLARQTAAGKNAQSIRHSLEKLGDGQTPLSAAPRVEQPKRPLHHQAAARPVRGELSRVNAFPGRVHLSVPLAPKAIPSADKQKVRFAPQIVATNNHIRSPDARPQAPVSVAAPVSGRQLRDPSDAAPVLTLAQLDAMFASNGASSSPWASNVRIGEAESYDDYCNYLYLHHRTARGTPDASDLGHIPAEEEEQVEQMLDRCYSSISNVVANYYPSTVVRPHQDQYVTPDEFPVDKRAVTQRLFELFTTHTFPDLYVYLRAMEQEHAHLCMVVHLRDWLADLIQRTLGEIELGNPVAVYATESWSKATVAILEAFLEDYPSASFEIHSLERPERYNFRPMPTGSVNLGLRILYRQTWTFLGHRPGDIVRTIPLGPKQNINISTKFVRTQKNARSLESLMTVERDTESNETTRESMDSSDESSRRFNIGGSVQAKASVGIVSGSAEVHSDLDLAASSKDAKSSLTEQTQSAVNRMRRETKAVVSTETETSFEENKSSTIVNPNEEIAVTYVYSRLSSHYEIDTRMAEVNSVVFVAEPLPKPSEVNVDWIRRHDSIIASVLLDASLARDLAALRQQADEEPDTLEPESDAAILGFMSEAKKSLGSFNSVQGAIPDLFRQPQESYERMQARNRRRLEEAEAGRRRAKRLCDHVRQNILHYCRAIWEAEDLDVRMQRYESILVPVHWRYRFDPATQTGAFESTIVDPARDLRPLSEMINPAGPIGYELNYSVWYLKSDSRLQELNQALAYLRSNFVHCHVNVTPSGSNASTVALHVTVNHTKMLTARVIYSGASRSFWPQIRTDNEWVQAGAAFEFPGFSKTVDIETLGIELRFDRVSTQPQFLDGDFWTIDICPSNVLQDPEVRRVEEENPLPSPNEELELFTRDLLCAMVAAVPALAVEYSHPAALQWSDLSEVQKKRFRDAYHEYLLHEQYRRAVVVETQNLILDLDVGNTSALEEFKRKHRHVDVFLALEEARKLQLENQRRDRLLAAEDFGDPDIEKKIVINSGQAADLGVSVSDE